jgi:hypothetical protein
MKFLKRYNQVIKLLKESTEEQESLAAEVLRDINDNSYISIGNKKYEALSFVRDNENFIDYEMKSIENRLDKMKVDYKSNYYKEYHPTDFFINYNKITGDYRDKLEISKYADEYYAVKNEWGDIGQSGGNEEYYFCDGLSGLYKLLRDLLWFYSENEKYIDAALSSLKVETFLQDILVNNDIGNDYKHYLLFYKNTIVAEKLIKKISEIDQNNNIVDIVRENKLFLASNLLYLLEKGYINRETILDFYPNQFRIVNNELYLIFKGDLDDFSFLYKKDDAELFEEVTKEDRDFDYFGNRYDSIGDIYIGELTDKAIDAIEAKIEEVKKTLDADELEEFDDYDNWEKQVKNIDSLSEIQTAILNAYNTAQDSADEDDRYKAALSPLLDLLGTEKILRDSEDKILFKFKKEWILLYDSVSDSREESYMGNKLTTNEKFGLLGYWVLKNLFNEENYVGSAPDLLEIDTPNYGWDGDIDKDYLEELIINNLSEF